MAMKRGPLEWAAEAGHVEMVTRLMQLHRDDIDESRW